MLTLRDYQNALEVENACNLSGVVKSYSQVMERIWQEARAKGEGTDWVNTHPIAVLYSHACLYLATGNWGDTLKYIKAVDACQSAVESFKLAA